MGVNAYAEIDLWTFSWRFYSAEKVAQTCLTLQDNEGWDVNLALFCLWLALTSRAPSEAVLTEAARCSAAWREEAVVPLRRLRRGLKERAAAGDPALAAFRERVKALELEAEKLQQARLAALGQSVELGGSTSDERAPSARRLLERMAALQKLSVTPSAAAQFDRLIAAMAAFAADSGDAAKDHGSRKAP